MIRDVDSVISELTSVHGAHVQLVSETYLGVAKKAKFIDTEYGEWEASVYKVLRGGQHPLRAKKLRIEQLKISHNSDEFKQKMSEKIKNKIKDIQATCVARFGVKSVFQTDKVKQKNKSRFSTPEAILKKQNTKIERRARNNLKRRNRRLKRVSDLGLNPESAQGYLANQTKKNNGVLVVIEGIHLKQIWRDSLSDKISYSYLCKLVNKHQPTTVAALLDMVSLNLSNIELLIANNPLLERFNKYPQKNAKIRPDFKVKGTNIFINVDGLYWHSEQIAGKNQHFDARVRAEELGIRLIQFRADEVEFKSNIVESMIAVKANCANTIYARKTVLKEIDKKEAKTFLINNHLMGFVGASKYLGLFKKDALVAVLSYTHVPNGIKIQRFATLNGHVVVGGYSKFLSYIKNCGTNYIETFVDLRYGTTESLVKMGFTCTGVSLGWKWTDYSKTYNRLRCRANMDSRKLSEAEYAKELGWHKIYDAGQAKLVWGRNED